LKASMFSLAEGAPRALIASGQAAKNLLTWHMMPKMRYGVPSDSTTLYWSNIVRWFQS
jgi:hypothetical protein